MLASEARLRDPGHQAWPRHRGSIALVDNMGEVIPGLLGLRLPLDPTDGLLDLIAVEADRPAPMQDDGDYVGEGSLSARVLPAALDVFVPAGGH